MKVKLEDVAFMQDSRLQSSKEVFDGAILRLYVNQLKLDGGQIVDRELIHHKPAVAILAATPEDKVLLVKQYRPAVAQYIYEVPAGILDKGSQEAAIKGAARELEEETGYQAHTWQKISDFYVSPGFLDEKITLYEATDLVKVENPLPQDDDEDIEVFEFDRATIQTMLKNGEIVDLKTLYALQYWLLKEK
ncbi:MAG: NUDIX hydrolase [Aerococcaceae bacterium]|nr:NUDIX hydrolase [Aerococcaceae bacterium]